ncbi:Protein translocase subunit SecD [Candidatus Xenohaliotis californiensis]|uniref:Protein translocase subunit SecD n=1 Tax=Candidatus Xenohaliotis californiensis TaxID=84677 RepID=A0ABM9N990_9RICK|nr:Protein translocase subunit SecD [Candidatus Xenohaliotis californiensis]
MLKMSYAGLFFVVILLIAASYFAAPNFFSNDIAWLPKSRLHFGLDLRGGSSITMQIDYDGYVSDFLDGAIDEVRNSLKKAKISYHSISKEKDMVVVSLIGGSDSKLLKSSFGDFRVSFDIDLSNTSLVKIRLKKQYAKRLQRDVLLDSIKNIRKRIDAMGIGEVSVQIKGSNSILLQIPHSENANKIKKIISSTAKMTFHLVSDSKESKNFAKPTKMVKDRNGKLYEIYRKVELDGSLLRSAIVAYGRNDQPVVSFAFNSIGTRRFAALTQRSAGKHLAIMIDNVLMTVATIKEPIVAGRGEISGNFTMESAAELALILRTGALPASLKIVEERIVGPTLGESSVLAGKKSMVIAFIGIGLMMVVIYKILGLFAVVALLFNLILLLASLTVLHAVLTLPGMAGIVLTIGMAVDGNIIIFERIKDEVRSGHRIFRAIEDGFSNATTTIVDSNLTTLISAIILFLVGTGPIRGFAVSLGIGVLTTLFSNVTINKMMIYAWYNLTHPKKMII